MSFKELKIFLLIKKLLGSADIKVFGCTYVHTYIPVCNAVSDWHTLHFFNLAYGTAHFQLDARVRSSNHCSTRA